MSIDDMVENARANLRAEVILSAKRHKQRIADQAAWLRVRHALRWGRLEAAFLFQTGEFFR